MIEPALFHALSLVLTFAESNHVRNVEVLSHLCNLLSALRLDTQDSGWKPKVSTLTAMLLLVGYECRINDANRSIITTHMAGVQKMMRLCVDYGIVLNKEIRRALFWQETEI